MGHKLSDSFNIADPREVARRVLPRGVFDFVDRGTEDDLAIRNNRAAFERITFRPRVRVDVSKRSQQIEIFDGHSALPLAVAPTGAAGLLCFEGEIAIATAAAKAGIPFALSTYSINSMEQVAERACGRAAGSGFSCPYGPSARCRINWSSARRRPVLRR